MLTTDRLRVIPLTLEQFGFLITDKAELERRLGLRPSGILLDSHTHEAMCGLYQEGKHHAENYFWYTYWMIVQIRDAMSVGGLCFMREPDDAGRVEVGYGIDAPYRNQGYMTEALLAVCNWAKHQQNVSMMVAETEIENPASARVLEKCGFFAEKTEGQSAQLFYRRFRL